ncbi:unnamed protein product [Triticum turgidum subsp. durum]|uniref:Trichome birefringence-like N-terminal domain-containing protein n=1 Tax=Triticum turgidum subsp. durum TaxID=4567 RepID=A0A9R1NRI5_TRITD|nr:unnamed protein product [Triticum turgidum subsp. durum]
MMMKVSPRVSVHVCLCNTRHGKECPHYNNRGDSATADSPEKMKPEQVTHNKMTTATSSPSPVAGLRGVVSSLVAFFIVVSIVSLLFDHGHESQVQLAVQHQHQEVKMAAVGCHEAQVQWTDELMGKAVRGSGKECNWSVGRWVYDNASQPLYSGLNCSFIFDEVACEKYGRNDTRYQYWRWQPDGCDLPRYVWLCYIHHQLGFAHSCQQPKKCSMPETI